MSKLKRIREHNEGLYIWGTFDGKEYVMENGDHYSIPSTFGDQRRMKLLSDGAKAEGLPPGKPLFKPGSRRVSDSEYEDQKYRESEGLIADPYDYISVAEELRAHGQ